MAVENKNAKRKPGGGRKPSKPDYNPSAVLQQQIDAVVALYDKEERPSLQTIADELDLNPIKVRKLLITAGVYKSDAADQVQQVFGTHREAGLSHTEAIAATMKELFIDRRENSKSLAWSSVLLAFHNIPSIGSVVDRPKALGDIRGVTYIYAMFYRFGLIDAPEKAKEKMEPVRNKDTEQMSFA